jgi:hypothetical protein
MFHTGEAWLPSELGHHKNFVPCAQEYAKLAFRHRAKAELCRLKAARSPDKDMISLDADDHEKHAQQLYAMARKLQNDYKEKRTTWEKMMPVFLNITIGVVVLAEVISLPLLIINICQMSKHKKHQQPS